MAGRRTAGTAAVQQSKRQRRYGNRASITEANRRRKRINHFHRHRNDIRGVEKLRKLLGIDE